ncbi:MULTISPECIES: PAS and ANTAR domain-containing protein [unclassified Arthrobacter]|jgi:hypothetical protein|uniref:PAS and ANTAR domain-containing protein n=1 Tax=unclassified Arthrobacter TaxID=235627 RepID=UPI0025B5EE8C|nr:PAS and ANTAR domain-containing protein [Arthrobacter sp. YD4]MDN3935566.1 PAS and ANTAR domain-containing protein [Arthrobacter sp. YD4]
MTETPGPAYASGVNASILPAGTFVMDGATRCMAWSDELYAIHGYKRGEVVPTLALTLAHKHPGDLPRIEAISAELFAHGGHVAIYHRIIDARSHEHRVLTAGEAVLDDAGRLASVSGVMLDLTSTIQWETELTARDAVRRAMATRGTIAKAEGILMGRLGVGSDEAFRLLTSFSNNRNVKLAGVAQALVALADNSAEAPALGAMIDELRRRASAPVARGGRPGPTAGS